MPVKFHLDPKSEKANNQQIEFFNTAMMCVAGKLPYRVLTYGGGIRGGKTSVVLFILHLLARKFKGSRWHVIRDSWPNLKETTLESVKKFFKGSKHINRITESMGTFVVEYVNGSKIVGKTLNYNNDKEINWMLGLETNGIFLEQTEGLPELSFTRSLERTGSWYIDPMPPGFVFATFNPTFTWSKDKFYDPWRGGTLDPLFYYQNALAKDNPFITQDQWNAWGQLDPIQYARMIEGDWTAMPPKNRFAYNFDPVKHVSNRVLPYNPSYPLHISFDFNIGNMSCVYQQYGSGWAWTIGEDRLEGSSDTRDLCNVIRARWIEGWEAKPHIIVTGDASGRSRKTSSLKALNNDYKIIAHVLQIPDNRAFPHRKANPTHEHSQIICNAMLHNHPQMLIDPSCVNLIKDLNLVQMNDNGNIDKSLEKEGMVHMLDAWRYMVDYMDLNPR